MSDLNLQEIANRSARVRFRTCEPNTDHEAYELARDAQALLAEVERLRAELDDRDAEATDVAEDTAEGFQAVLCMRCNPGLLVGIENLAHHNDAWHGGA